MSYQPQFTISPVLLQHVERIAALRERIAAATVEVPWMPALQMDSRVRNAHSSTAIYDLKAVNPNRVPVTDTRTPFELLDTIAVQGRESDAALARLRGLIDVS